MKALIIEIIPVIIALSIALIFDIYRKGRLMEIKVELKEHPESCPNCKGDMVMYERFTRKYGEYVCDDCGWGMDAFTGLITDPGEPCETTDKEMDSGENAKVKCGFCENDDVVITWFAGKPACGSCYERIEEEIEKYVKEHPQYMRGLLTINKLDENQNEIQEVTDETDELHVDNRADASPDKDSDAPDGLEHIEGK